ncbi:heavy metal translocating P-type ATPase [Orbaceae bacterium ESL0721]|nr:heavy metal translocating P-type ATPase [Orbaceae bacterium ESL0721]
MLYNNNSKNSDETESKKRDQNSYHITHIHPLPNNKLNSEHDLIIDNSNSDETKLVWHIMGMDCAHCAQTIENGLKPLSNKISRLKIIFATEKLVVWLLKSDQKTVKLIENKIVELGFTPILETTDHPIQSKKADKKAFQPLITVGLLIIISYLIQLTAPLYSKYAFIVTAIVGLVPITKKAVTLFRSGTPFSIETLLTISATGALFIGAAEEACMVIFLFMIGEMLEAIATNRAKKGISSLVNLMPQETTIIKEGKRYIVATNSLKPNDIIEISAGGRLPADVKLISDTAVIDESALTGESIPVNYFTNDKIMAGSLVVDKTVQLQVISKTGENAIDRILQLIEDAEDRKAPIERFIDKFSRYYTPIILLLAILIITIPPLFLHADWYRWIYRGLTLLLIGCPCALVISTPAAITSALSNAAKFGVLIKGGIALENIGAVKVIAFDKTGTLTEGRPQITDILLSSTEQNNVTAISQNELLELAAAIEIGSNHPLAKAIVDEALTKKINIKPADNRKALPGIGVQGDIDGKTVTIRSPNKMSDIALSEDDKRLILQLEERGKTVVVIESKQIDFSKIDSNKIESNEKEYKENESDKKALDELDTDKKILGIIALQDRLRADASKAIKELHVLGLKTVMLTGDNRRAAKAIADELNIDYFAELTPAEKLIEIEKIHKITPIAMVGDGINDSPAMKSATVGIAMGSGSDVALESADAALTKNSLLSLPTLIRLTRFANRNIRQNITIALGIKALFLITSILGITGLWLAVLADSGTTAIVTANALRLLRFKDKR